MRILNPIAKILLVGIFLSGCSYNVSKEKASEEANLKMQSVSDYQSVRKLILAPQCLNCHSNAAGNRGGLNLESYESVKLKLNQIYYRSIEVKDMPPGGLDKNSFEALKGWIENGAQQQASVQTLNLKGAVGWQELKSQVFQYKCLECHSAPNPEGKLDLSEYQVFKDNINSVFDHVFVKQDMPMAPYPSLSLSEKNAILKWISQGMPQ